MRGKLSVQIRTPCAAALQIRPYHLHFHYRKLRQWLHWRISRNGFLRWRHGTATGAKLRGAFLQVLTLCNIITFKVSTASAIQSGTIYEADTAREWSNLRSDRLTLILLMWRIGWAPNSIPIYSYIQQDAMLHSLFISRNCSTCFGSYFHPSSGTHTTVSTAPGICHNVTAICRYRGRVWTGLSVLWVAYVPVPTIAADSSNIVTNTKCCRYSCLRSWFFWWYHPKHVEQFPDKINYVTLHLVGYILE